MESFLKFSKQESVRLRKVHNEIVSANIGKLSHPDFLRVELKSSKEHLFLADELDRASRIVRQAIATAKDLSENGGLT